MSGGHFDYAQHQIAEVANDIQRMIDDNNISNEYNYSRDYRDDVIANFKVAVNILRMAEVYTQRIDWLVSGDDGEDSFIRRLSEDLTQ